MKEQATFESTPFKAIVNKVYESYLLNEQILSIPITKINLFLTHRSNIYGKYSNNLLWNNSLLPFNIIEEMLKEDFSFNYFEKLLPIWLKNGLKTINFMGGEPTLHKDIIKFIELSHQYGIKSVLFTNGTTSSELLRTLIIKGLNEIHITIYSFNPIINYTLSKLKFNHEVLMKSLKTIFELKKTNYPNLKIVLKTFLTEYDISNELESIKNIMALEPDDIELLLTAEKKDSISQEKRRDFINRLLSIVPQGKMKILNEKIVNIFRKTAQGLDDNNSKHIINHCYMPLVEYTVDTRGVYPCIHYLRNVGKPIAKIELDQTKQKLAIWEWIKHFSCFKEMSCFTGCPFKNKEINLQLNFKKRNQKLEEQNKTSIIIDNINQNIVQKFNRIYTKINKIQIKTRIPFMIIKPEGIKYKEKILSYIHEQIYGNIKIISINNWVKVSLFLYAKNNQEISPIRFFVNEAHSKIENNSAILILFPKKVPLKLLHRVKNDIRLWFGEKRYLAFLSEKNIKIFIQHNYIHTPTLETFNYELKVLNYFKLFSS